MGTKGNTWEVLREQESRVHDIASSLIHGKLVLPGRLREV